MENKIVLSTSERKDCESVKQGARAMRAILFFPWLWTRLIKAMDDQSAFKAILETVCTACDVRFQPYHTSEWRAMIKRYREPAKAETALASFLKDSPMSALHSWYNSEPVKAWRERTGNRKASSGNRKGKADTDKADTDKADNPAVIVGRVQVINGMECTASESAILDRVIKALRENTLASSTAIDKALTMFVDSIHAAHVSRANEISKSRKAAADKAAADKAAADKAAADALARAIAADKLQAAKQLVKADKADKALIKARKARKAA